MGGQLDLLGHFRRYVRNLLKCLQPCPGDAVGTGIMVEQVQDPGSGEVFGQGGQLGKDAGQEIVEAIDRLGCLFDLGLEASGNFA